MKFLKKRGAVVLISCVLILAISFSYIDYRLKPQAHALAKTSVTGVATEIINEAVMRELKSSRLTYDSIITLKKDANDKVTALCANTIGINMLKGSISLSVSESLKHVGDIRLTIPLGNLFDGELLSGKGPNIPISFTNIGSITSDIKNSFSEAGINQTLHTIYLEVKAYFSVAVAKSTIEICVTTKIAIAETVLVGDVPEAYTYIEGGVSDELIGDINDFQATLK